MGNLTLHKALSWTGRAAAVGFGVSSAGFLALVAREMWNHATPAGQISGAVIAGCGLIAGAVWLASRRPPPSITLRCDAIDGLDLFGVGGNVYVVAPSATRVQEIHHVASRSPVSPNTGGGE